MGVHSFLPVSKQAEKSAGVTLSFQYYSKSRESNSVGVHSGVSKGGLLSSGTTARSVAQWQLFMLIIDNW